MCAAKFSAVFPGVKRDQVVARMGRDLYGLLFTVGRNLSFASGLVLPLTLIGILLRRYELVSQCPNCGEHQTIARMSSTEDMLCQHCGDSMLKLV